MSHTALDTYTTITDNGLAVRQIPHELVTEYPMDQAEPGDVVIETCAGLRCQRKRIPPYAGQWLCKQVPDNLSAVEWNAPHDNAADTLEQSVRLWKLKRDAGR